jgi:hypothetical protein
MKMAFLLALVAAPGPTLPPQDLCYECHRGLTGRGGALAAPANRFTADIHRAKGFTCASCHGGNPTRGDVRGSHDPARGFRGIPRGRAIIETCAKCHADPSFMKRYNPSPRIDQATEYWTSQHGVLLRQGDERVATCVSCHDVHGILPVKDPQSTVYPLNVAATCARCHGSPIYMKRYRIPSDQVRQYELSVHYQALTQKRDFGTPTCNKCHGNHGAAPPGVKTIVHVCGQCHTFFEQLYEKSAHAGKIEKGCVACHGNHAVLKPTDEWLGAGKGQACVACHRPDSTAGKAANEIRDLVLSLRNAVAEASDVLERAQRAGLEVRKPIFELRAARDSLTQARKVVHSLEPKSVQKVVEEGLAVARKSRAKGEEALAQIAYRRNGLLAALGALALVVVALFFKLREIESRPSDRDPPKS